MIEHFNLPIEKVKENVGQIPGLQRNPRTIKDGRLEKLKKSIRDLPEMTEARDLLVFPFGDGYVVIGGNMRLKAYQDLGWEKVPCCVLPSDTPVDKLREIVIQDNNPFGEMDWDAIATEWDVDELRDWGVELPEGWDVSPDEFGDGFSLPDGEKKAFQQMTFTFSNKEADLVRDALKVAKADGDYENVDFGGNENKNGNALYLIVKQWVGQRK